MDNLLFQFPLLKETVYTSCTVIENSETFVRKGNSDNQPNMLLVVCVPRVNAYYYS